MNFSDSFFFFINMTFDFCTKVFSEPLTVKYFIDDIFSYDVLKMRK
jgi:hypothetical protein